MTTPCAPILILAFNRPAFCEQVISAIRPSQPTQVFLAVDGPRPEHPSDLENCKKTRSLASTIDWPCEVKTFFRKTNRGCKYAPPEAITWFFSHVTYGIILEDDCVPSPDFLNFASELLKRYDNTEEIGMISGNNHFGFQTDKTTSYHFSRGATIWGWATWKRAWSCYDVDMKPYLKDPDAVRQSLGSSEKVRAYCWRYVEAVLNGMDTWDVQWSVALNANQLLTIRPKCNLVSNSGFTTNSTHTPFDYDAERYARTNKLDWPLIHPTNIMPDYEADLKLGKRAVSYWRRFFNFIGARGGRGGKRIASLAYRVEKLSSSAFNL